MYAFKMTENELAGGIKKIGATVRETRTIIQNLMVAACEYAHAHCNASHINNLVAELPERWQRFLVAHVTRKGVALKWDKESKKLRFDFKRAMAIIPAWDSEKNPDNLSALDRENLEKLTYAAVATLSATMWDEPLKAEQKAEREAANAAKSTEEKAESLRKRLERLNKDGEALGITFTEGEPVPASLRQVVEVLRPFADDSQSMGVIMVAITAAIGGLVRQQAA